MTVYKIVKFKKPSYLAQKLVPRAPLENEVFPHRQLHNIQVRADLTLSRAGLVYRGAKLWNSLPPSLKSETSLPKFKKIVRRWVTENVPAKPP